MWKKIVPLALLAVLLLAILWYRCVCWNPAPRSASS